MRNLIRFFTNIVVGIWNYITGSFRILFNAVNEFQQAAMIRIRRYFIFLFCGNIIALAILLLGLILHSGTVIVISAIIAASMLLLTYITFIVPAAVISFFAGDILGMSKFQCIKGAARSALFPLLSCSFFISALASILASAGIKSIPLWTVVVYGAFALVLIILSFFSKENSMTTHYLALVLVIWNFLIFAFPIPTKSVILTVADTVNKWSVKDKTSAEGQIVLVVEGAKLYRMNDDDEFIQSGLNIKESRAKIIDWEKDSESSEDVYKVLIDSSGQDNFIAIKPVFVSLRSIKLIEQPKDKPVQNIENQSVSDNRGFDINVTTVGSFSNNAKLSLYADRPFKIIYSLNGGSLGYSTVEHPAGYSTQCFENGGDLIVEGKDRKDVRIIKEERAKK